MALGVSRQASQAGPGNKTVAANPTPPGKTQRLQPKSDAEAYGVARLERAVASLVTTQDQLLARLRSLEVLVGERDREVTDLRARVRSSDDKRAGALVHLDGLIDQLDELEGRMESSEEGMERAARLDPEQDA